MNFDHFLFILSDPVFQRSFLITMARFITGTFVSILLAGIFVWLGFKIIIFGKLTKVLVSALQPIPKIILFPVLLIVFGMNDLARILLVVLGLFFTNYTILNNAVSKLVMDSSIRIIQFYKVSGFKTIYFYYIKGLKEALLTILKNSVGYGLTLTIISESSFCNDGIGFLVWTYWERYELFSLSVTIFLTSVVALLFNFLCEQLVKKI